MERTVNTEGPTGPTPVAPPVILSLPIPSELSSTHAGTISAEPELPSIALVAPPHLIDGSGKTSPPPVSGMRRLLEAMVLFFSVILFLRAMAVEPFGVPTGSMAPTLTGNHTCACCPRCGYPVRVGKPLPTHRTAGKLACPNCESTEFSLDGLPEIVGDRLLVDKNVFGLRGPRRWEVAVFRCPVDDSKPYVKRVAALPNERLQIIDGDLYINGELARKSLADARQTAIPFFEMRYVPQGLGWHDRWDIEAPQRPLATDRPGNLAGVVLDGNALRLEGAPDPFATMHATYRNVSLETQQERALQDTFVYNGPNFGPTNPVHDFFVELELDVLGGVGAVSCQLADGRDEMTAYLAVGSGADQTRLVQEKAGVVRISTRRLEAGKRYRVEMAFVDRRASLAIDGREPFRSFDLPPVANRADVSRPLRVGVQGVSAVIRNVRLCRDIYYRLNGRHAVLEPYLLAPDEYFMLGDNSANSDDSRSWERPGVPERNFLGKPFLLHQPSRVSRLQIGDRINEFQSIDWSRIRWLR